MVTGISISPATASIRSGQAVRFTATASFDDQGPADVTADTVFTLDAGNGRMALPNGTPSAGPGNDVYQSSFGHPAPASIGAAYSGFSASASVAVSL